MEKLKVHDKYFVSNVIHFGYIVFQTSERICFLREFGGFFLFIIIRPVFFLSEIKKKTSENERHIHFGHGKFLYFSRHQNVIRIQISYFGYLKISIVRLYI